LLVPVVPVRLQIFAKNLVYQFGYSPPAIQSQPVHRLANIQIQADGLNIHAFYPCGDFDT
jgi:hypothetical protein